MTETHLPMAYKPLSPWAYFGLQLLFSLPVVGFICLIVFSFDNGNIHRRNFARSYWCSLVLGIVLSVLLVFVLFATGLATEIVDAVEKGVLIGTMGQDPYGMGYATITTAARAIVNMPRATVIYSGHQWMDAENLQTKEVQSLLNY